jgi:hypothetical protein
MLRKRIYYSDNEITDNLYTSGLEWMLQENNNEYIGLYHRYLTGEVFTEATWNPNLSQKLIPYETKDSKTYIYTKLKPDIITKYVNANAIYVNITAEDRKTGYIYRYFIKRYDHKQAIETSEADYQKWLSSDIDPVLYQSVKIKWIITGQKQTTDINGIKTIGVYEQNSETIKNTEITMPGISATLSNPLQYYSDTDFIVPKDINQ